MSMLRHFGFLSHVLVLLSILAACLSQDAIWMLVLAGTAGAASRLVTEGLSGFAIGRRLSLALTGLLLFVIIFGLLVNPNTDSAIDALVQFGVWITVIKLYERRTVEIDAERLTLSVLLMVLACMEGFDLIFGLVLASWSVLCVLCILLFQLHYGANRDRGVSGIREDDEQRGATIGQQVRLHFRRALFLTVLIVVLGTMLLFVVFPRGVSPQMSTAQAARVVRTGAGNDEAMTLVSGMRIVESPAEVGTVTLTPAGGGIGSIPAQLYLRTATASEYVGAGRWQPSGRSRSVRDFVRSAEEAELGFGAGEADWILRMNFTNSPRYIPVPAGALALRSGSPLLLEIDRMRGVIRTDGGELRSLQVRSTDGVLHADGGPPSLQPVRGWAAEMAREILRQRGVSTVPPSGDARLQTQWRILAADSIVAHLRSKLFRYTLDLSRIGQSDEVKSVDPIRRFLTVEPAGNCEYFAAAFVLLTQGLGMESRIVSGFRVSPEFPDAAEYVIRDRDAHSWSEVRVDAHRWVRFDPTAARRDDLVVDASGFLGTINGWYQEAEAWWRLYILGYDSALQETLADEVLPGPTAQIDGLIGHAGQLINRIDRAYGLRRFGSIYVGGVAIFIGATVWIVYRDLKRRKTFKRKLGLVTRSDRRERGQAAEIYRTLMSTLARVQLVKPDHLPPLAWCDLLEQEHPDVAPLVRRVVGVFYASHYGGREITAQDRLSVQSDLRSLKTAMGSQS
ncbi:MAG: DUF3488 and transglutaminase-like domain-containing protein [Phycisphaerales bacterium]|nr:DUF3488 and transglutaminase-like domain-containing protein [Phycisphaerales bacterium]